MMKTVKIVLGYSVGLFIGSAVINLCNTVIMRRCANNDEFLEYQKEHDPEYYERLKKYRK
jgi:hypothetical protein